MKRIVSLLTALLLVVGAGAAIAENPPADPAGEQAPDPVTEQAPETASEPEADPAGQAEDPAAEQLPEEEADPQPDLPYIPDAPVATPTDLCAHSSTRMVYYFDAPEYLPLDSKNHQVSGPALVEIVCNECGSVISAYKDANASEVRAHVGRKGKCALCGWEAEVLEASAAEPREFVQAMTAAEENADQFFCTVTGKDLQSAGDTLVLRPEGFAAALALQAKNLQEALDESGGSLTAELGQVDEKKVNASIRLYDAEGTESAPENREISLRFYAVKSDTPLSVTYTNPEGDSRTEKAAWMKPDGSDGFWSIPWLGDGTYGY